MEGNSGSVPTGVPCPAAACDPDEAGTSSGDDAPTELSEPSEFDSYYTDIADRLYAYEIEEIPSFRYMSPSQRKVGPSQAIDDGGPTQAHTQTPQHIPRGKERYTVTGMERLRTTIRRFVPLNAGAVPFKRVDVETACESFVNIIGTLSDATLYKGTLSSGVEIAVSVLKANEHWHPLNKKQFKKKIALLSKVGHKNFVNLIGYCEKSDPFSRMLIFEYAPNGTLFEHLHVRETQDLRWASWDLSWASRLRIAMGVAYCLEHMHQQLKPPIILKNLDSNMIHLTDDFAAKIADMELWSKTSEGSTGTGPSETLQHEMVDKESIIHKFGMVLLELLSGRPPYSDENFGLVSWASDYLKGRKPLKDMIDPVLHKVGEEDVRPFFGVIKDCLSPYPKERPTMTEVAARLKLITGISQESAAPKLSPLRWPEAIASIEFMAGGSFEPVGCISRLGMASCIVHQRLIHSVYKQLWL